MPSRPPNFTNFLWVFDVCGLCFSGCFVGILWLVLVLFLTSSSNIPSNCPGTIGTPECWGFRVEMFLRLPPVDRGLFRLDLVPFWPVVALWALSRFRELDDYLASDFGMWCFVEAAFQADDGRTLAVFFLA